MKLDLCGGRPWTSGGIVETGPDFEPKLIVDRELITGQNPRSDHAIAAELIAALARGAAANTMTREQQMA